jgi:hypothetical protein
MKAPATEHQKSTDPRADLVEDVVLEVLVVLEELHVGLCVCYVHYFCLGL